MPNWLNKLRKVINPGDLRANAVSNAATEFEVDSSSMTFLKIKIKSLAEEAKLIRGEESKHKKWRWVPSNDGTTIKGHWEMRWLPLKTKENTNQNTMTEEDCRNEYNLYLDLYYHRTIDVRQEARHALLAYGYIRGRRYEQLEENVQTDTMMKLNVHRVERIVRKFAPDRMKGLSKDDGVKTIAAWWKETRSTDDIISSEAGRRRSSEL